MNQQDISKHLREQREREESQAFESFWYHLMRADDTKVAQMVAPLDKAQAIKVISRLNAAPGDKPVVRQLIGSKFPELGASKTAGIHLENGKRVLRINASALHLEAGKKKPKNDQFEAFRSLRKKMPPPTRFIPDKRHKIRDNDSKRAVE